jgi:hypothetical protein
MSDNPNVVTIEDDSPEPAPAPKQDAKAEVQQPAPEPAPAPEEDKAKKGTKFVELPPELDARFKRIYANMKAAERNNEALFKANVELIKRLDDMESRTAQEQTTDQMTRLKNEYAQSQMSADYGRAADILEQMADLKAAAKQAGVKAQEIPKPVEPDIDLSQSEQQTVVAWGQQTDDNGQPLRPWANPSSPKFAKFQAALSAVTADPDYAGAAIPRILAEVDRMMGGQQRAAGAAPVLTSSPDVSVKTRALALSDGEKKVAERMFHYTGIVKSAEEAHNRYRAVRGSPSAGRQDSNRYVVED